MEVAVVHEQAGEFAPRISDRQRDSVQAVVSPRQLADERWQEYLAAKDARDATGDEPLSYTYCSSNGPEYPPKFHLLVEE